MGWLGQKICDMGYSSMDIIQTLFRVVKNDPKMPEFLKLEFIRVSPPHNHADSFLTAYASSATEIRTTKQILYFKEPTTTSLQY